jgi:hypothetical protein
MSILLRKCLAVVAGVIVVLLSLGIAFALSHPMSSALNYIEGTASVIGPTAIYKKFGDWYSQFSVMGMSLSAGVAAVFMLWPSQKAQWPSTATFWTLLAFAMPLTIINYWERDTYASRGNQAMVDLILVLLSAIAAKSLVRVQARSDAAVVLRSLSLYFLVFQGVLMPATFGLLWWLNWQSAITKTQSESITPGWISAMCAIGSFAISTAQYVMAKRKQDAEEIVHRPFRRRDA